MDLSLFLIIILLSTLFNVFSQNYLLKNNFIDKINARSSHNVLATRSGGLSIFSILFLSSVFFYLKGQDVYDFSILVPLSILFIIGLYDDLFKVDFKLKFIFQIIAAKILIDYGFIIDNFHGIMGINELDRMFAQVFTIFIIVAIINSINFIDGIDGLAISVVSIFIILYEYFSINEAEFQTLSIIILASFIPLIYFNFRSKKKVFLGDSGSIFLGGLVSVYVLNILSNDYIIKKEFDLNKIIFIISILSYPIIDLIRVFFIRILKGRSPFIADRNHLHHILLDKFKSHILTSLFILFMSILFTIFVQLLF
jgi:UDP-GlcNAc:undecaprenyl-phosphate GlcNAc-1-phosphate transferase